MSLFSRGAEEKFGQPPGTPVQLAEKKVEETTISVMDFNRDQLHEMVVDSPEGCRPFSDTPEVTWINVEGIHDIGPVKEFGEIFGLSSLVVEDILNPNQRPKFEDHGDYLFVVMKFLDFDEETNRVVPEQISLILGKNYILTFQEKVRGKLDPVSSRIRNPKARIRTRGIDYTFYSLLDVIVDGYFVVLEKIGESLAELEERIMENPEPEVLQRIFENKVNMMVFRRATWPLRDMANMMIKGDSSLINEDLEHFFKDLHDHLMNMVEISYSAREMTQGLTDLYLSVVNHRMNEVMKVLTIIATIFIPLTFLVGVYGMNFKYMPELEWRWGYFAIWGLMGFVGLSMYAFFIRKKWM